ncbi:MAG: formylglycine-generating enzyme family protein [Caulobacterales bacterium]
MALSKGGGVGRAPTRIALAGQLALAMAMSMCLGLSACGPRAATPKATAADPLQAAPVAKPQMTQPAAEWDAGYNSDDFRLFWGDKLGQGVSFVCSDDHDFYIEVHFAATVMGKPKSGRLYAENASRPGFAKVYSGDAHEFKPWNEFQIFLPLQSDLLQTIETASSLTVELGTARIAVGRPPAVQLKDFIKACAYEVDAAGSARPAASATELPLPVEAPGDPIAAAQAAASGKDLSLRGFRDALQGGGWGPDMVALPAGRFIMGSPPTDPKRAYDETQKPVQIDYQFAVGRVPVTVYQYNSCVAAGGCRPQQWMEPPGPVDQLAPAQRTYDSLGYSLKSPASPIVGVDWNDARAYAAWLSRATGQTYRLMSDAEWDYAARAGTITIYPWGDAIGRDNANCTGCGSRVEQWDNGWLAPVGSFAPNAFGLYDMVNNAGAWVEDCKQPDEEVRYPTCLARGGSWHDGPPALRSASRSRYEPERRSDDVGIRVARVLKK